MTAVVTITKLRRRALVGSDEVRAGVKRRTPSPASPTPSTSLKRRRANPTLPAGNLE